MKQVLLILSVFVLASGIVQAQDRTITGTVTDKDGQALAGAVVQAKGTSIGTFSKAKGKYKITVPSTATVLVFKQIGKKSREMVIGVSDEIDVLLEDDALNTDEVVVTAIGLERTKKSLGYATQEVTGNEIVGSRETNVVSALSGKVAGVQVNNSSGVPGGSSFIRIRGSASITGDNQPLFVVDGIPIDNSQLSSGNPDNGRNNLLDGVGYSNRAIDINPNDIESMTVLKGPAATALYGIRASGGAIIITTKKGVPTFGEKVNIQFNSSWSIDQVNRLPELQNKFTAGNGGVYAPPAPGISRSWGASVDTLFWDGDATYKWDKNGMIVGASDPTAKTRFIPYDNQSLFYKTGLTSTNSVNMFGGDENATYYLSFSRLHSSGVVPNSEWARNTIKFSGGAQVAPRFRASANFNYVNSGGNRTQHGSNVSGVVLGLVRTPNSFDNSNGFGIDATDNPSAYSFADGTQRTYRGGVGYDNPFWTVNKNRFSDDVNRMYGNMQLNWNVLEGVDIMYRLGGDFYSDRREDQIAIGSRTAPAGRIAEDQHTVQDITSDFIVTVTHQFNDDFGAQMLLGNNMFSTFSEQLYVQGDGLGAVDFFHLSNTSGQISRQSIGQKRTAAFYGDLRLNYQQSLFFNATVRKEWSTSLPQANNSFVYPAFNLSVVMTELLPELKSDVLSFLKLRLSWARGGQDAPIYGTRTVFLQSYYNDGWTDGISFPFGGSIGYMQANELGNPELKPESNTSQEVGFDIRFFENRLGLDFTYYRQLSEDQIFLVPVAASSGYLAQLKNAGSILNTGAEIVLTATPIMSTDFRWDMNVNFSKNESHVVSLTEGVDNITIGGFQGATIRAVAGMPYGSIYGFGWARDANGNRLIDDDPNSATYGQPIIGDEEKAFGSANPDFLLGIRNSLTWKGLSFSFLFDIRQGGVLWNGTRSALIFFGTAKETEARGGTAVLDGVKKSNGERNDIVLPLDENWYVFGNANGFFSTNTEDFIEDASWVRLREVSLSYALPKTFFEDLPISGLTVSVTGRNLWLSTEYKGIDPETSLTGANNAQGIDYFNMPSTRSYNFALSLNF